MQKCSEPLENAVTGTSSECVGATAFLHHSRSDAWGRGGESRRLPGQEPPAQPRAKPRVPPRGAKQPGKAKREMGRRGRGGNQAAGMEQGWKHRQNGTRWTEGAEPFVAAEREQLEPWPIIY